MQQYAALGQTEPLQATNEDQEPDASDSPVQQRVDPTHRPPTTASASVRDRVRALEDALTNASSASSIAGYSSLHSNEVDDDSEDERDDDDVPVRGRKSRDQPRESAIIRHPSTITSQPYQPRNSGSVRSQTYPGDGHIPSPEPTMRSVSSEGMVDLEHPTPDLQALQGAYVGNVQRLERSAERLSTTSSSLGEELRKIRYEQKKSESRRSSLSRAFVDDNVHPPAPSRQFSASSVSKSIIGLNNTARTGGYSPGAFFTSPVGSLRSESRSRYVSSRSGSRKSRAPQLPELPLDRAAVVEPTSDATVPSISPPPPPPPHARPVSATPLQRQQALMQLEGADQQPPQDDPEGDQHDRYIGDNNRAGLQNGPRSAEDKAGRPSTAASTDTYQQANTLFTDFDGIHLRPKDVDGAESGPRSVSLNLPPTSEMHPSSIGPPSTHPTSRLRHVSTGNMPTVGRPVSYLEPPLDQDVVYYPAPVPLMLNLPKRLSKAPPTNAHVTRRSKMMGPTGDEARRSALQLPEIQETDIADAQLQASADDSDPRPSKNQRSSTLPPQLRASAFFEHAPVRQSVMIKEDSAVATLDSILDASAHAPVSAFTHHPIAGRVGAEVYGREAVRRSTGLLITPDPDARKSRSSLGLLRPRRSSGYSVMELKNRMSKASLGTQQLDQGVDVMAEPDRVDDEEGAPLQPNGGERRNSELGELAAEAVSAHEYDQTNDMEIHEDHLDRSYRGAPTTLLAELQIRKQQQKLRNRTAATAFPDGMHSTLLELDAVAQVQKESRRHKRIALAWEDPQLRGHQGGGAGGPGEGDDEDDDVPLGMLFPNGKKNQRLDEAGHVIMGLAERREVDDNEPLSRRKERLKGPEKRDKSPDQHYLIDVPGLGEREPPGAAGANGQDEGEETLAQRIRRLKQHDSSDPTTRFTRTVSEDFASELISQFGGEAKDNGSTPNKGADRKSPKAGEDETLGQRRKRLQREGKRGVSGEGMPRRRSTNGALHTPSAPQTQGDYFGPILPGVMAGQQARQTGYTSHFPTYNNAAAAAPQPFLTPFSTNPAAQLPFTYPPFTSNAAQAPYANPLMSMSGMGMPFAQYPNPNLGGYGNNLPYPYQYPYGTYPMNGAYSAQAMNGVVAAAPAADLDLDPRRREVIDRWREGVMP
ncbi:MAG: hypothetical protein M1817_003082 [Caeruleum heppii]|nr:MAG: hypothetical protein M1817_003082 [Caeruleum heppii]